MAAGVVSSNWQCRDGDTVHVLFIPAAAPRGSQRRCLDRQTGTDSHKPKGGRVRPRQLLAFAGQSYGTYVSCNVDGCPKRVQNSNVTPQKLFVSIVLEAMAIILRIQFTAL